MPNLIAVILVAVAVASLPNLHMRPLVLSLCVAAKWATGAESQCAAGVKSLMGRSFEIDFVSDAAEHTYTIVVGSHMTQTDKSEGTSHSLGKFSGISSGVHHYTAGDACEFVDRSAEVMFRCGATDDVVSAEEPSACEFSFVIETPLCCAGPHERKLTNEDDDDGPCELLHCFVLASAALLMSARIYPVHLALCMGLRSFFPLV